MASFAAEKLSQPPMEVLQLLPTDDVTLDRGEPERNQRLKVEGERRRAYLRFDIPERTGVRSARLRLTQSIDSGTGTLRYFLGDHADWSEDSLAATAAPSLWIQVAERTGVVQRGQVIEVDVSNAVQRPGPITIIVTLDTTDEDDIWFGSRESDTPPQLILSYPPSGVEGSQFPDTNSSQRSGDSEHHGAVRMLKSVAPAANATNHPPVVATQFPRFAQAGQL